jgi:hypothetical protein
VTAGSQRQKQRRLTQSKYLSSEGLWASIGESLDILSRTQENRQRITTAIVGKIEGQNSKLIAEWGGSRAISDTHCQSQWGFGQLLARKFWQILIQNH